MWHHQPPAPNNCRASRRTGSSPSPPPSPWLRLPAARLPLCLAPYRGAGAALLQWRRPGGSDARGSPLDTAAGRRCIQRGCTASCPQLHRSRGGLGWPVGLQGFGGGARRARHVLLTQCSAVAGRPAPATELWWWPRPVEQASPAKKRWADPAGLWAWRVAVGLLWGRWFLSEPGCKAWWAGREPLAIVRRFAGWAQQASVRTHKNGQWATDIASPIRQSQCRPPQPSPPPLWRSPPRSGALLQLQRLGRPPSAPPAAPRGCSGCSCAL